MNKVVIILNESGKYVTAYADSEVNVEVLRQGKDDRRIDIVEESLEEVETE